jgi:hypothetical protein
VVVVVILTGGFLIADTRWGGGALAAARLGIDGSAYNAMVPMLLAVFGELRKRSWKESGRP